MASYPEKERATNNSQKVVSGRKMCTLTRSDSNLTE